MQVIGPVRRSCRRANRCGQQWMPALERAFVGQQVLLAEIVDVDDHPRPATALMGGQASCDAGLHGQVADGPVAGKPRVGPTAQVGDAHGRRGDDGSSHASDLAPTRSNLLSPINPINPLVIHFPTMAHELPKALREDVRLLGELLGETLRRHEGQAIFDLVERVRALAKKARGGSDADFATLTRVLEQMPVDEALPVARAFSHFLNLANIAEQHHRIRRRRDYQRDKAAPPQIGSCDETFGRLIAAGIPPDRLHEAISRLRIELVFTAHPTEVTRRTLMQKFKHIADLLEVRDRADLTPPEHDELLNALRIEIAASWETSEVRQRRPSPIDEARSGMAVFEQALWDAVPQFLRSLNAALVKHTGRGLPPDQSPLTFGSWIGGDRDGNPAVTAPVTETAACSRGGRPPACICARLTRCGSSCRCKAAAPSWSHASARPTSRIALLLRDVRDRLSGTLRAIEDRLEGRGGDQVLPLVTVDEIAEPLALCRRSLEQTGNGLLARGRLLDLQRRVAAFGVTLVRLDLRQDASRHTEALSAITRQVGLGDYAAWSEDQRQRFLLQELESRRPLIPADLRGLARRPGGPGHLSRSRRHRAGVAWRVRDLDGAGAIRCPGRRVVAEGSAPAGSSPRRPAV